MNTISSIETKVTEIVGRVAQEKSIEVAELGTGMRLIEDVGLKSLDLARIVALLQEEYPVDPFAELVPITSVRTLGDLAGAYHKALEHGDSLDD